MISGALVTRQRKDNPLLAEQFIARNKKEIINARGSKYCPVSRENALKKLLIQEGKKNLLLSVCLVMFGK